MSANGAPIDPHGLAGSRLHDRKLVSWKEIAVHLGREIRTVQRWEKTEGLPVRRHEHQKRSTVYAYAGELDEWFKKRQPADDPEADAAFEPEPDVTEVSAESENGNASLAVQSSFATDHLAVSGAPVTARPKLKRLAKALAAAAAISVIAYAVLRWIQPSAFLQKKVRLVVIPFTNLSADAKQDYFSAGLTDEMTTRLGSLDPQHLGVIAAASSNELKGKAIAEIGHALDVQYALEGSVRRDGNRVRIDVQLIQVSDQTHLWAASYDRELDDILRVQDDVGAAVASQIPVVLNPPNSRAAFAVTKRTVNPEAYDAYLRGRFYWTNRGDLHKSIDAYQQAIQKDPQYALAYAGLASSYALLGQVPYDDLKPSDAKPKAREAAERALQLDPQLTEAHAVLANVAFSYDWNFGTAEREFQQAVALGPNNPVPHIWYGQYCIVRNRLSQALEENSRALDLDPVSPLFNTVRAEIHYHARNFDAAIDQARRTIEQYPTYPLAYIWLGSAYRQKKMYREALDSFSQGRRLSGDHPAMIALYGHTLAVSGDAAGARKALAELQHVAQSRYVSSLYFAAVYMGLGEKSTALDWLDRAYQERNDRLVYLGVDPMADPLRSEPRFTELLRKIGIR
ncbi:MAG TPA: tetratricopeptide repeat protein [Candidatus Sulfotelmatobacter sp.]|nr:tetratricopeptide repeat protein [Candidatus Sulfotelmatobacter sp.]